MPKAYSYIRMSTQTQLQGDSLRRQLEASEDYANQNGLTIDTTLSFKDIGYSAFDGTNIERGGLGKFLDAVKRGVVETNSTLIVESLDRLSRQKVRVALQMFLDLLNNGINIVTLMDGRTYTTDATDNIELISSILIMSRANEESVTKSKRVGAAWQKNRNNIPNRNLTRTCPGWLQPHPSKKGFDLIPKRVAIIQRIFIEAAVHGMGANLISRRLNKERIEPFGRAEGWSQSYIMKILREKTVLGEFQPHLKRGTKRTAVGIPISDYYPAIIDEDIFYRAQAARFSRRKGGGRKGAGFANIFSGLLRCGTCHGPVWFLNKGTTGHAHLFCGNARRNMTVCFTGGWRYQDFEKDFLTFIKEADLANIIGHIQPGNELTKLKDEIRATEGRLLEARTHRDKAFSLVLEQAPSEFLNQKVREYDLLVTNLETTFSNQNQMLHVVTQQTASFEEGKEGLTELIDKLQSVNSDEVFSLRSAVAFHLKSITDYIGVWSASRSFSVRFKDGTFRFARPNVDMAALSNTFDGV